MHAFIFRSFSICISSWQSESDPRSSNIIQDTLWALFRWSVNTRERLELLPTGVYSSVKTLILKEQRFVHELSCSLGEQMLRLAKSTVMLARRADPSLGEGRAFQKISESFGPQLTSSQAHYPRNQSINTEVSVEERTWSYTGRTAGERSWENET